MPRFDEVELDPVPGVEQAHEQRADDVPPAGAARSSRLAALFTDLSAFVALGFIVLPLLPQPPRWHHVAALAGFVVMLSYYYFVGSWMLWGKTIGGAIFDVRVVPEKGSGISLREATIRWAALYLSIATLGLGFALAALPSRRSLPDRLSTTRCV